MASHIRDLYLHAESERVSRTPGVATPVRKRPPLSSQTQFVPDPTLTASSVSFAQQRIENELTTSCSGEVGCGLSLACVHTCILLVYIYRLLTNMNYTSS